MAKQLSCVARNFLEVSLKGKTYALSPPPPSADLNMDVLVGASATILDYENEEHGELKEAWWCHGATKPALDCLLLDYWERNKVLAYVNHCIWGFCDMKLNLNMIDTLSVCDLPNWTLRIWSNWFSGVDLRSGPLNYLLGGQKNKPMLPPLALKQLMLDWIRMQVWYIFRTGKKFHNVLPS